MLITSLSRSAMLLGGVVFLGTAAMSPARAGGLSAAELSLADAVLSDFNVVTFGDYHANNETEGRVAVGGNFLGTGHNICFNGCSGDTTDTALGATYGALNVWGNVSGGATLLSGDAFIQGTNASGSNLSLQHNGGVNIVGQNSGQISNPTFINTAASSAGTTQNAAAGTIKTGLPANAVFPFSATLPFQAALTDLSTSLASLATTSGAQTIGPYVQNGPTSFTATPASGNFGGKTYGLFTTTMSDLAGYQNFAGINTNGLDAVIVVVTGSASTALPNLNTFAGDASVIWDFVDTTTLNFAGGWAGQILAPDAVISNPSGDLTGAVIGESLDQGGEVHNLALPIGDLSGIPTTSTTTADVPEPPALALLATGALALAALRRRAHVMKNSARAASPNSCA